MLLPVLSRRYNLFIEPVGVHTILGTNDIIIRKCDVIRELRLLIESFQKRSTLLVRTAEGGHQNLVRSRLDHDLARSSEPRY